MARFNSGNFMKSHPGVAALAASALIATPMIGIGVSGMFSNAAELPAGQEIAAPAFTQAQVIADTAAPTDAANFDIAQGAAAADGTVVVSDAVVAQEAKSVHFEASGAGHIEPVENCAIDGTNGVITFADADRDAKFRLVADADGASGTVMNGQTQIAAPEAVATLDAEANYDLNIEFIVPNNPVPSAEGTAPVATEAPVVVYEEPVYVEAEPVEEVYYYETVEEYYEEPSYSVPATRSHSMNSEEMAIARDIFNAYNDFRASKGLPRVAWDDTCANMAYASATGCASRGELIHRLGIPGEAQNHYSDILQYATWKMSGSEAVSRWEGSNGHRKMMQCDSTGSAGVAAYKHSNGKWYYVIVYNFDGCNQSGY